MLASTSLPEAVPPTIGGFGTGATAVGFGGVGAGLTGPSVFAGLGLTEALADAVVAAAAAGLAAAELAEAAAEAAALLAAADAGVEAAALNPAELEAAGFAAWLAGAELWRAEWLQAALRPASAAIMVAVTAVLGVRLILHLRPGRPRSEVARAPDSARALMPRNIRRSIAKSPNSISTTPRIAISGCLQS